MKSGNSRPDPIIVVGGGHAGCEAALAAARMGCASLLVTLSRGTIGLMSCNPAIGGLAKGQLVKEIDALGGEMGKAIDATGIQFRRLNTSKGPAVQSSRAQADRRMYQEYMRRAVEAEPNLEVVEGLVEKVLVKNGKADGVETAEGRKLFGKKLIITPGTFLNGLIHIGLEHFPAGRIGEPAAEGLAQSLKEVGFALARFKTGTCPRLDGRTIKFSELLVQDGDEMPRPFSFWSDGIRQRQVRCFVTYTNPRTHEFIREGLDRSPLYTGVIKSTGVRYCPSIEDKVMKFPDRERHQIFLEPEGLDTYEYYPNGLATSLPLDVQTRMLRSIKGLEEAEITRPGYGIEHTIVEPTQLMPTLETKAVEGLYLAGQINGTTGYEEAAAQGLIAGINAALALRDEEPLILERWQAYIGVLIDDLVTKGTNEPYRMFTSRAEYRLVLREDNADIRLAEVGYRVGLVNQSQLGRVITKKESVEREIARLKNVKVYPGTRLNEKLNKWGTTPLKKPLSLWALLKRPQMGYDRIKELEDLSRPPRHTSSECTGLSASPPPRGPQGKMDGRPSSNGIDSAVAFQVEVAAKYQGYIRRQEREIERFKRLEKIKIPANLDFGKVPSLSREVREKLEKFRPLSLGQALRISGVTPAAISILMVWLKKCPKDT